MANEKYPLFIAVKLQQEVGANVVQTIAGAIVPLLLFSVNGGLVFGICEAVLSPSSTLIVLLLLLLDFTGLGDAVHEVVTIILLVIITKLGRFNFNKFAQSLIIRYSDSFCKSLQKLYNTYTIISFQSSKNR